MPFTPAAHRARDGRLPGVRALVLYPMNALVEDQLVRLRRVLDSDDAIDLAAHAPPRAPLLLRPLHRPDPVAARRPARDLRHRPRRRARRRRAATTRLAAREQPRSAWNPSRSAAHRPFVPRPLGAEQLSRART